MNVFITGADGLLGSHVVRLLQERGHAVRAFLLPNRPYASLEGLDIEKTFGNILNPGDIAAALKGCEAVIHIAADTTVWPSRSPRVRAVNVDGTKNMLEVALAANINRFVHIGSASSFGFGSKSSPGTETTPFVSHKYGLDYIDSKYEGQKLVLDTVRHTGLPAVIIAPTFMFGPYDAKPGSGRMILAVYQKKLPAYAGGGRNFVAAQDVATAVVNALSMGRAGESYIAGNANLSYREITTLIAEVVNVSPPRLRAPNLMLKTTGGLASLMGHILRIEPRISYPMAKISCDGQYFSSQKAVTELQMPQTDIRIAIREAFEWFVQERYC